VVLSFEFGSYPNGSLGASILVAQIGRTNHPLVSGQVRVVVEVNGVIVRFSRF
jgi:hypothetical protein